MRTPMAVTVGTFDTRRKHEGLNVMTVARMATLRQKLQTLNPKPVKNDEGRKAPSVCDY